MDTQVIDQRIDHYDIVTYWSEIDGAFIAEMPQLAGCMSDGSTEVDARNAIRVIAQEWINRARYLGREIPEPRQVLAA